MKRGNKNAKILKKHENRIIGIRVELTRKMTIDGKIIYAVVITNMRSGIHILIQTFSGISDAFKLYKEALA